MFGFESCGYRRGGAKIPSPCVDQVESRQTCSGPLCNCNGGNFISDTLLFSHNFFAADVFIYKKENRIHKYQIDQFRRANNQSELLNDPPRFNTSTIFISINPGNSHSQLVFSIQFFFFSTAKFVVVPLSIFYSS